MHVCTVTTLFCFNQDGHKNDFSFMTSEQQRLIVADMINNDILRWANGIKDDDDNVTVDKVNKKSHRSDSSSERASSHKDFDELEMRLMGKHESELLRKREKEAKQKTASANQRLGFGKSSVYSNLEMVMKQLWLCQREAGALSQTGSNGRKFKFPNY